MAESDSQRTFKEKVLAGRTPGKFVADKVIEMTKGGKEKDLNYLPTKYDIATVAIVFMQAGYFTEQDLADSVKDLGLTPDETKEFIPKTLPETKKLMEEEARRQDEIAQQERKDFLRKYTEEWGLSRLDSITGYFKSQITQAEVIDPRWQDALDQYPSRRPQIEEMLGRINNPKAKASILMRELYALSNIHPSEILEIFKAERETKSYVYPTFRPSNFPTCEVGRLATSEVGVYFSSKRKSSITGFEIFFIWAITNCL